ncbi:hypothetical protein N7537_004963 [Penicillium hordei]|uniref:DUF7580 domain-containing protein n=1 Tax=Penicillium hordei TaxID=40994 RepID=A0AAD6ECR0_9EURO|nr:uncharacterized protein N7537_004963 [Penicillium hordei]KAJ5608344.1 hypothetical protein N7537_004963 [Penicillium hordei]
MLLTGSLGWIGIQAVKSRLIGRLARFTRNTQPDSRPQKLQNDAAFFEADLRYILTATPVGADFSEHDYADMDQMAQDLLASLNDMVNGDLIGPLGATWIGPHDISLLRVKYPRLTSLIAFLDMSMDEFNLTTGSGSVLFILPQGQAGSLAMERITNLKAFLQRFAANTQKSQGLQIISPPQTELSEKVYTQGQPGVHVKRASIVVNAIFKEFRQLSCGEAHEIKLRVSDEWQTGPFDTILDIFVSCCPDGSIWQQAKCGFILTD